ncbi:lipopolysaccharide 3-alpha-galactosyltransferase [Brenneria roseae subsp. roseae]|uniref:lipopolysaccharide 3-alpha-galactosyltransferase n=1 Tax=Brenneria roseae TaxID=1509241 RepID=UPI000D612C4F|nr:lipopolysaccharide 3-alpha-galactosyltransferase [Brenneria roseae]PWC19851.1 lipopolysaccharide 3-alpha-galactosyltransferase [Brenneria roseae subsp. roseae]
MYFNKEMVIEKVFKFSFSKEREDLNIAFGTDKNFLYGCAISIASILLYNKDKKLSFHIFTDLIDEENKEKFRELAKLYNADISIYIVNCEWLKNLPSNKNWSYAIYFRFIASDYLLDKLDKFLYLDSDIICKGDIQEIIALDINNVVAAVITDRDVSWWEKRAETLGVSSIKKGYFNSGVLLINLKNWDDESVTEKTMEMLKDDNIKNRITYPDQDILNMLLSDRVIFLDKKYNTQFSLNYELKCKTGETYPHPINDNTIFIHYIGPTKPWHEWAEYPSSSYFYIARNNSPWKDVPLEEATSANQLRYCAKHQFHKNKIINGIINYIKYFLKKTKNNI